MNEVLMDLMPGGWKGNPAVKVIPNCTRRPRNIIKALEECTRASEEEKNGPLSNASLFFNREIQKIRRETKLKGQLRICLALPNSTTNHNFVSRIKSSQQSQGVVIEEYFIDLES